MDSKKNKEISKFLSYILRHNPKSIDLVLDDNGWAFIDELIYKANNFSEIKDLNHKIIEEVVDKNDKKRFIINEEGNKIRANQGHSVNIDLQLKSLIPPEFLYHGTAIKNLEKILTEGIKSQSRQYVHLSESIDVATKVGQRHGKATILKVSSLLMHEKGFLFYKSDNGVWLTQYVPSLYIESSLDY